MQRRACGARGGSVPASTTTWTPWRCVAFQCCCLWAPCYWEGRLQRAGRYAANATVRCAAPAGPCPRTPLPALPCLIATPPAVRHCCPCSQEDSEDLEPSSSEEESEEEEGSDGPRRPMRRAAKASQSGSPQHLQLQHAGGRAGRWDPWKAVPARLPCCAAWVALLLPTCLYCASALAPAGGGARHPPPGRRRRRQEAPQAAQACGGAQ